MILEIKHQTVYAYESPVSLEPQHLYFYPLQRVYLQIRSFELNTNPHPKLLSERQDLENNFFYQCWFDEPITNLEINVSMKLETQAFNPFDFLEENHPKTKEIQAQRLYLTKLPLSEGLIHWSDSIIKKNNQTISFLSGICDAIHDQWDHKARYDDSLLHPDECFDNKEGSCRDLSWMLIQVLRYHDIPARFVSGYSFNPELGEGHELHAWVEVFINGAGWIGLDPSSGLLTTELYVPIATSYHPMNTLPVQGSYRGESKSDLATTVKIRVL